MPDELFQLHTSPSLSLQSGPERFVFVHALIAIATGSSSALGTDECRLSEGKAGG